MLKDEVKIIFLSSSFIFCSLAWGQELSPFINYLADNLNQNNSPTCSEPKATQETQAYFVSSISWQKRETCIKKICPDYDPFHSPISVYSPEARILDQNCTEPKQLLVKWMNSIKARTESEIKMLKAISQNKTDFGQNEFKFLLLNNLKYIEDSFNKYNLEQDKKLSPAEFIAKFYNKINDEEKQFYINFITNENHPFSAYNSYGADFRYKSQFPDLNLTQAVQKDLEQTHKTILSSNPEVQKLLANLGYIERIDFYQKNLNETSSDSLKASEVAKTTDQVYRIINLYNLDLPTSLKEKIKSADIDKSIKEIEGDLKNYEDLPIDTNQNSLTDLLSKNFHLIFETQKNPDFKSSILDYMNCLTDIEISLLNLPTNEEIKEFHNQSEHIKQNFTNKLNGKYSETSFKIIQYELAKIKFAPPPSKESYKKFITDFMELKINQNNSTTQLMDKDPVSGLRADFIKNVEDFNPNSKGISEEIKQNCKLLTYTPLRDNVISDLDQIQLGSESIKNQKMRDSIIAHELGHKVKSILDKNTNISEHSKQIHHNIEKCLLKPHEEYLKTSRNFNNKDLRGSDFYLEEDYADLISSQTTNKNLACKLNIESNIIQGDLNDNPKTLNFNRHSSSLYRLLHVEVASGRPLEKECSDFLKDNDLQLKNCYENSQTSK